MATSREQVQFLIKVGLPPSTAAAIVAEAEQRLQKILNAREAPRAAAITPADLEAARSWWYYSPAVPNKWRRILDAQDA